ncbi:uncharacterized protein N0V96_000776 [Colletotrichum fioriniae]|uniref:uncharacterized protein n=1 Tax=Colletotrichum fioriniae TaxID=710243 RepID=UPI0032DB4F01|nr:hypothetical protein N0V96_000776 [Colletotrichum fioriniae]
MASISGSSVAELCEVYKKSTNCFLGWLWCQGRMEAPGTETLNNKLKSTADIIRAAKVLQKAKSTVPSSILGLLRTAIEKRQLVANIYEELSARDGGHQGFSARCTGNQFEYHGEAREELSDEDKHTIHGILDRIREDLDTQRAIGSLEAAKGLECKCFTPICEPFFVLARDFVRQDIHVAPTRLVLGLILLLITDNAVPATDAKVVRSQCRLKARLFTMKVRENVLPILQSVRSMDSYPSIAEYWQDVRVAARRNLARNPMILHAIETLRHMDLEATLQQYL